MGTPQLETTACLANKQTTTDELISYGESLFHRISEITDNLNHNLESVCRPSNPRDDCDTQKIERDFPPLLAQVRGVFKSIEDQIEALEDLNSRINL